MRWHISDSSPARNPGVDAVIAAQGWADHGITPDGLERLRSLPADTLVLVGSNLAWCHPVLFQRLETAKRARPSMKIAFRPVKLL